MKPSIIAAHQAELNSLRYSLLSEYSKFADKVSTLLDKSNDTRLIQMYIQQLQLVSSWINIVLDYTMPTTEADDNLLSLEDFYEVIRHLNRIFNTEYWIEL
jgi:hypothetical protein